MANAPDSRPLADRMRPRNAAEFIGQAHLLGAGKPLHRALESGRLHSMILWGPPGTGKTTLARMLAESSHAQFIALSAVMAGGKEGGAGGGRGPEYSGKPRGGGGAFSS